MEGLQYENIPDTGTVRLSRELNTYLAGAFISVIAYLVKTVPQFISVTAELITVVS